MDEIRLARSSQQVSVDLGLAEIVRPDRSFRGRRLRDGRTSHFPVVGADVGGAFTERRRLKTGKAQSPTLFFASFESQMLPRQKTGDRGARAICQLREHLPGEMQKAARSSLRPPRV